MKLDEKECIDRSKLNGFMSANSEEVEILMSQGWPSEDVAKRYLGIVNHKWSDSDLAIRDAGELSNESDTYIQLVFLAIKDDTDFTIGESDLKAMADYFDYELTKKPEPCDRSKLNGL